MPGKRQMFSLVEDQLAFEHEDEPAGDRCEMVGEGILGTEVEDLTLC